jgi:thermitase
LKLRRRFRMKTFRQPASCFAMTFLLLLLYWAAPAYAQIHNFPEKLPSEVVPGEVLVGIRSRADVGAVVKNVGQVITRVPQIRMYRLRLHEGVSIREAIARLSLNADVQYAEPNRIVHAHATPNDPLYGNQYGPHITQADSAWGIWQPTTAIELGVLDSGVFSAHPDLANKIAHDASGNVGFNGFSDQVNDIADHFGHGTAVTGIAAAQIDNGLGIAGIAGWNGQIGSSDSSFTKVVPVKVLDDSGSGTLASLVDGIVWAADHGLSVINMSVGFRYSDWPNPFQPSPPSVQDAVFYAWARNVLLAASAGNDSSSDPVDPASIHGVISVAATDRTDALANYSNYGSWVYAAAPGSDILSTTMDGGYTGIWNGTSFAAPHVSGEAALIRAQNPTLDNDYVSYLIETNVDSYTPYQGHTIRAGGGRINIFRALAAAGTPTVGVGVFPSVYFLDTFPLPMGLVSLSTRAPAGGATIALSTLEPDAVTIPSTVTIAEGGQGAHFIVEPRAVPEWYKATIIAKYNGGVGTATVWLNPNPEQLLNSLLSVLADQETIREGAQLALKIALSQWPGPDFTIQLTSSNTLVLRVPNSVTLSAPAMTRALLLDVGKVKVPTAVTITARAGKVSRRVTVRVVPSS